MSRRRLFTAAALVLAVCSTAAPAGAAAPDDDPFYGVPAGIDGLANGTVIDSRAVTATQFSVPIDANAWQVRFKTEDNTGAPSAYITTVLVPRKAWTGSGPRPVLSYQMPEDGVALKCAPSWVLTQGVAAPTNTTPDAQTVASALEEGWAVSVPDYEGPRSAWLGADGQARGVLDGVRAARAFKPAGIDSRAPVALWGYSGGAIASSTAAQLQPAYAPDLKLAGVALGGNNATIRGGLMAFDGSAFGGAIIIGFIGLDRAYPEYALTNELSAEGKSRIAQSQGDCIAEAAVKHPAFRASSALKDPKALDRAPFTEVFRRASPLTYPGTPDTAVYDYHATGDELAPIGPSRQLLQRFCREGVKVQSVEEAGEHFTEVANGQPGAMRFLAQRFAGQAPVNDCKEGPSSSACSPAVQTTLSRARLTRRRVSLRGTAAGTCGAAAATTHVALARKVKRRCRFLTRKGRLGRARSCARPLALTARGTAAWKLSRKARVPAGRYRLFLWTGARPADLRAARRLRVR